ncbi:MAG: queuosine precursor transporter [Saprospiraceae bacterium]|nr:queuosine precursor transporter [Bacteroidia bacterium]NNE15980.1 queuosine precursor transporter [Saprospiraceae bacterium]NNL92003.1 queuosine precursor transporter [Saprospiraceae bacterium]
MFKNKSYILFLILGGFFITNALIAQLIGVKIFSLEETFGFTPANLSFFGIEDLSFNLTAGVLLWPVVFVMTDIINEYFGKKGVRILSFMAVGLILYAFLMILFAIKLAPNEWWTSISGINEDPTLSLSNMNLAFQKIFGQGLWIIVGSLIAFLIGQFLDVLTYHLIRNKTGESKVWLRATGSTLISQFIDSYVVLIIAFYFGADWTFERVAAIATVNYIYKFIMAVGLTPVIYLAHFLIDKYLGIELAEKLKLEAST